MTTIDDTHTEPDREGGWGGPREESYNTGNKSHRPNPKSLQALKDMANKLRIDSIESTNTADSGYVCSNFMLNFAAWLKSQLKPLNGLL